MDRSSGIVFLNNDVTSMDEALRLLADGTGLDRADAFALMFRIHRHGAAILIPDDPGPDRRPRA